MPAKIEFYDQPRVMYLRRRELDPHVYRVNAVGQTTRSWVEGLSEWNRTKYKFSEYEEVTREEHDLFVWARENRYKISQRVDEWSLAPSILRKIADLIGYEERA